MVRYIKKGITYEENKAADLQVKATVEQMLQSIAEKGDDAVRELSAKLDKWSPSGFRLSQEEIKTLITSLPAQVIEDIKFAQAQIRNFAQKQKDAN